MGASLLQPKQPSQLKLSTKTIYKGDSLNTKLIDGNNKPIKDAEINFKVITNGEEVNEKVTTDKKAWPK